MLEISESDIDLNSLASTSISTNSDRSMAKVFTAVEKMLKDFNISISALSWCLKSKKVTNA